jgi:hypothetical protein
MTLAELQAERQLDLPWDASEKASTEHLAEWVEGSAVSPEIAQAAIESISGSHQVLGFLNPSKLGRNLGYATMPVQRARQHYANPIKGGWLASGHAPLLDGAMVPITLKPDVPRHSADGKPIKYERPAGKSPTPFFAPLDSTSYAEIAKRANLTPPAFTDSWSAWQWLLAQPEVELVVDEGEKKAAAACSHGFLTIGLAGIWNGCPRPRDAHGNPFGAPTLIAELHWLRQIRPAGSPLTVAFDASDKPSGRIAIRKARRCLGRLLEADGHLVQIREMIQPSNANTFIKGTDDLIVWGGADAVSALPVVSLKQWLHGNSEAALSDHLLHPFGIGSRRHRTIDRHFRATDVPAVAKLVALVGGMGSNKTGAIAKLGANKKIVSITHRRSLADDQGQRFGLPVKREGQVLNALDQSQASLRQVERLLADHQGFITVADASHLGGSGEVQPDQCHGAVLFIDEADAFLRHCLNATTAIKANRCEVLTNLAACCAAADQVVLAGAHIDELTLQAFEAMAGGRANAHIVESTLHPASGRVATIFRQKEQLLQKARNLASDRQPFIVHTGSAETKSKFSPANLARLVRQWWPDARILEMTASTIREPNHPAEKAVASPKLLLGFDVVVASPVLETGFSIEDPQGHFCAVLGHSSGHTTPTAMAQSLGRLRSNAPRFIYCESTGSRIGNGASFVDELERDKLRHAELLVHLVQAGDATGDAGQFLRWWSKAAADQNWIAGHYRHALATLMGREGYEVNRLDLAGLVAGTELSDALADARDANLSEETTAVALTPLPTPEELEKLEAKQRLTVSQRRAIERGRIHRDLGIEEATAQQVAVSRNNGYGKALLHLLMSDPVVRQQWQEATKSRLSKSERSFAPDFTKTMAPASRAKTLAAMPWISELLAIAGTGQTTAMATFEQAHQDAAKYGSQWRELLGFDQHSGTTRTFVANMLNQLGFSLRRTSRRQTIGEKNYWHYEVLDDLAALDRQQVQESIARTITATGSVSFFL